MLALIAGGCASEKSSRELDVDPTRPMIAAFDYDPANSKSARAIATNPPAYDAKDVAAERIFGPMRIVIFEDGSSFIVFGDKPARVLIAANPHLAALKSMASGRDSEDEAAVRALADRLFSISWSLAAMPYAVLKELEREAKSGQKGAAAEVAAGWLKAGKITLDDPKGQTRTMLELETPYREQFEKLLASF
jgi:hypothetical protein